METDDQNHGMDVSIDAGPSESNADAINNIDANPEIMEPSCDLLKVKKEIGTNTSPRLSYAKRHSSDDETDEEMTCPICLEEWDNSSEHRVVSLKCGHLFGKSCVERWLKGHQQCCPQCKCKSKRSDIRKVYAKTVKVKDTSERDRALRELEAEKSVRLKLEIELQTSKTQLQHYKEQLNRERERKMQTTATTTLAPNTQTQSTPTVHLQQTKSINIKDGQCRVMATTTNLNFMAISQYSPNKLFPGFGVRKINTSYLEPTEYVALHKDSIRDMSFHPGRQNGILLTASMDKSLKLTCMTSNNVVHTFPTEKAVWACTWNSDDDNHLFAGLMDGSVLLFDMRQTNTHLLSLPGTGSFAPVASLQYVPFSASETFSSGGLIVGQLNRCTFMESTTSDYKSHVLPIRGPITSICFEPHFRHMLVSCRPNSDHPTMSHTVYELVTSDDRCACNEIHMFVGGELEKMLSRNLLLKNPFINQGMLACAGDESRLAATVWDVRTGSRLQTLHSLRPVIAINSFNNQDCDYLATLAENSLSIYTFSSS